MIFLVVLGWKKTDKLKIELTNGLLGVEVIGNRGGLGVSTLLSLADLDSLGVFSNLLSL